MKNIFARNKIYICDECEPSVITKKEEKLMLQLVNVNGNHANESCATEDMIPPVLDVEVSIACSRMPQKLILQPAGRELAFTYRNGRAYVQIARIDIHDIIEVIETTSR